MKKYKKVAIIHDCLIHYGGSERVLEDILRIFPEADLYTFYFNDDQGKLSHFKKFLGEKSVFLSFKFLYKLGKYFSILKILSFPYFYFLNLDKYDLVISSSHSFNSKLYRKSKNQKHVSYVYTPPKFLYQEKNELKLIKSFPVKVLLWPIFSVFRYFDKRSVNDLDLIYVSSSVVRKRILKYYGAELNKRLKVVSPAIKDIFLNINEKKDLKKEYYLFHSRLVKQKGLDLIIDAANKYGFLLKVVGEGGEKERLKKKAKSNIDFLSWQSDKDLLKIYAKTKALLFAARDEDFGLVLLEAMSSFVPVIAYKSGSITELIKDDYNGFKYSDYDVRSLMEAINQFERSTEKIGKNANNFAKDYNFSNFKKDFLNHLSKI